MFFKVRSFIIAFSFLLTLIILVIDNQPQYFPLLDDAETPDCLNIDIINISKDINRIQLFLRARPPFIEFPIESASHLIKINAETSTAFFTYYYSNFWDFNASYVKIMNLSKNIEKSNDFDFFDFNFNILHTISGIVSLSVYCSSIKLDQENEKSEFVSSFKFSIDRIQYYPVLFSKIEFNDTNTIKFSGLSIFNSNLIYHTQNIAKFKPFKIGKKYYNISCDIRNSIQFCEYSNQSFYNDEVFIVSSESLNELNPQLFFSNCILRIFCLILKINDEVNHSIESNKNSTSNLNENNNLIDQNFNSKIDFFNTTENLTETGLFNFKLLIINDSLNTNENLAAPISIGKFKSFESLFGPNSIEFINMVEKKCFREGIFMSFENDIDKAINDLFLSKINDSLFNSSLLKKKYLYQNLNLNNSMKIKTLIDSKIHSTSKDFDFLDLSDNINEIANKIYVCDKFIVTQIENLPFSLFMHEGAELIQIGGNQLIGQKISNLTNLAKFLYCDHLDHCEL